MQKLDRALIVALNHRSTLENTLISLDELEELAKAASIHVVDRVTQSSNTIDPKFFIGSGKVDEIKKMIDILNIDLVIFDDTLSAGQIRNLEETLDVQIMDRSFLILQIFAERAKTKQAVLEVSLAQKMYLLPRLVGMTKSLSRQGGGSFNAKGPGETKLELNRRVLADEITRIKRELSVIKKERAVNAENRKNNAVSVVALVGYTNAGKSSLMNHLVSQYGSNKTLVFEEDMLFATLDTKAKRIKRENYPAFILIDTVGFISKLPPELIFSFESTLSDVANADLIIHVVDGQRPNLAHIQFTRQILSNLKSDHIPRVMVLTKSDLKKPPTYLTDDYISISSKTGENIDQLMQAIDASLYPDSRIFNIKLPFSQGHLYQKIKDVTRILYTNYEEDGIHFRAVLTPILANQLKKYIQTA